MASVERDNEAEEDYLEFFRRHSGQSNPTDINTVEKFDFMVEVGFDRLRNMQRARKQGLEFSKRGECDDE